MLQVFDNQNNYYYRCLIGALKISFFLDRCYTMITIELGKGS